MANKALCVGINDYPLADLDLNGCINDAKAWATLLRERFDFPKSDVTLLLDARATKAAIVDRLKDLLAGASRGDVLVFTSSAHGTYRADRDDEEADRYDEAICPHDCKDHLLLDDELRALCADIPWGVRLTVISDSCHSGSVTRALPRGGPDRRPRFVDPRALARPALVDPARARPRSSATAERDMRELLLSGCRSDQFSYDARFGQKYHGAMTFHAIAAIEAAGGRISYRGLAAKLRRRLADDNFPQEPQLEGRAYFKRQQVFT